MLVGDDVAMAGGVVDAPPGGARIGVAPGRSRRCRCRRDRPAWASLFVRRVQLEGRTAAALLVIVEGGEIAAVAAIARELAGRDTRAAHHPGDEGARPRLAGGPPAPVGMAAASPIVADLAGERFAALGDAAAVCVAADLAAVDDGRTAEPGPFLPGGVGDAVGGRAVGVAAAGALAATRRRSRPRSTKSGRAEGSLAAGDRTRGRNARRAAASKHEHRRRGSRNSCMTYSK